MSELIRNEYDPDAVTPPGDTLQEMLDTVGMTKAELAERIGKTQKHLVDIIKHGAPITPTTAMELEKALSTPASFWNNRESRYRESLARQEERKRLERETPILNRFPVYEMAKAGWISKHKNKVDQVHELLRFFGVASFDQWESLWFSYNPAYRQSKAFKSSPEAGSAWLRQGELQAQFIECQHYNRDRFRAALSDIRQLTRTEPEQFESKTVQLCAVAGVAVVFTPPIKGAPIYGATRWLTVNKALIQLSSRGKFEDLLWFTFFHEAGHILLHGKKEVFIEDDNQQTDKEKEADKFAANFLIFPKKWREFVRSSNYRSAEGVKEFAEKIGIAPAIVVGRLQHQKMIPYTHLNGLRRRFDIGITSNL
ncbi:MAG: ImmA/IrrE family metallo-endopeptidase [Desulfobacterales bacterium]